MAFTEAKRGKLIDIINRRDHGLWDDIAVLVLPPDACFNLTSVEVNLYMAKTHQINRFRKARLNKLTRQKTKTGDVQAHSRLEAIANDDIANYLHELEMDFDQLIWINRQQHVLNIPSQHELECMRRQSHGHEDHQPVEPVQPQPPAPVQQTAKSVVRPSDLTSYINFDQKSNQMAMVSKAIQEAMTKQGSPNIAVLMTCTGDQYSGMVVLKRNTPWAALANIVGATTNLVCKKATEEVADDPFDPDKLDGYRHFIEQIRLSVERGIEDGQQQKDE